MSASVKNLGGGTVSSDGYTLEYICDLDDYTYQNTQFRRFPASVLGSGKYSHYYFKIEAGIIVEFVMPADYGYSVTYYRAGNPPESQTTSRDYARVMYIENAKTNVGVIKNQTKDSMLPTKLYGLLK